MPSTSPAPHRKKGDITQVVAKHDANFGSIKLRVQRMPANFIVDVPIKVPGERFGSRSAMT